MRRSSVLALALTLGLALSVVAGAVSVVGSTAVPAPEQTRDLEANAGATMSTEPWPGADAIMSEAGRGFPDDPSMVTIVLGARWGVPGPVAPTHAAHGRVPPGPVHVARRRAGRVPRDVERDRVARRGLPVGRLGPRERDDRVL